MMTAQVRRLAATGGVWGPVAFIGAWAVLGATRTGYAPAIDHISDLAALGTDTRPWMTAGFVAYGLGLPLYGAAALAAGRRTIGGLAIVTGLSTLAVAAFPLGPGPDRAHVISASIGYVTLAAIPLAGAVLQWRGRRFGWAALSVATGVAAAAALAASTAGAHGGLWQRVGLTLGDAWVAASAAALVRQSSPPSPAARI